MEAIATSPIRLSMLRQFNTWYTIANGNWNDPNIWISNGKRIHSLPQEGDNVYIGHNVSLNTVITINSLYIAGKFTIGLNNLELTVNGDLQVEGSFDCTGANPIISLNGYYNHINSFIAGNSTVVYNRAGDQNVMPLVYQNLKIRGTNIKYLTANTIVNGNLGINEFYPGASSALECGNYDLTVIGDTNITFSNSNNVNFYKSGVGNLLFVGSLLLNSNVEFSNSVTNIEFRGGISGSPVGGAIIFNCPVSFTTNSQTVSISDVYFNDAITILGIITIDITSNPININGGINGDNSNSTLTNNGYIEFGSNSTPMSIGIFNWMSGETSSIAYSFNGNYTLPYKSYRNLAIYGSGIKSLSGDTTVLNLRISDFQPPPDANLDCGPYDLTVNGNFQISALTSGALLKTDSGKITFIGSAGWNTQNVAYPSNVILEFRNGVTFNVIGTPTNTIDATINFSTNSQTFSSIGNAQTFNGTINIVDDIIISISTNGNGTIFNGEINGLNNKAKFQALSGMVTYNSSIAPMTTGILDTNSEPNIFIYGNGNQNIKAGTYRYLTLQGGGIKTLLGDVSIVNTYILSSPATLDTNGFTLTNH
jgi:hypothetical protein